MKLWEKGKKLNERIEAFTVGDDYILDLQLVGYDCQASAAHAKMLGKIGVLTAGEVENICRVLSEIAAEAAAGTFTIDKSQEDCHTAIEARLTDELGDAGKKIHTARSRNDQVLVALRIYIKDQLREVRSDASELSKTIGRFVKENGNVPLPGYTHTRKAMPTTVGTWATSFQAALKDDRKLLKAIRHLIDQSPLGSGAGFGIPVFKIDREFTADQLGFKRVQENPIYVQNSRGKFEALVLHGLFQVMADLNKMATDLIWFSLPVMGFFELPESLCTGSSIMPQKQNPDVLELVRSSLHTVSSLEQQIQSRLANLTSGYHRDMQLSKGPLMRGFSITSACLEMMNLVFTELKVNRENCQAAMTGELYATEQAYKLVKSGMPFREAYLKIGKRYSE